jgi:ADP-ribosylglycohydrolase
LPKLDYNRFDRAWVSLEGLSTGDAFGESFFAQPEIAQNMIKMHKLPPSPWAFTDDTLMALSVVSSLRQYHGINQDLLASSFAARYNPCRGYGPIMDSTLTRIREGEHWKDVSRSLFSGRGSVGNGAAMRVAPIGAYFADDIDAVVIHARRSAEVTHAHPEAIAGAVAVAVASAWAWRLREYNNRPNLSDFVNLVLPSVPESEVSMKIRQARDIGSKVSVQVAAALLGNGMSFSAQDTIPFTLWCAGQYLNSFEEALWLTVSGQGDCDTTCAIVGGIVVMYTGVEAIPKKWLESREPLPQWFLNESYNAE